MIPHQTDALHKTALPWRQLALAIAMSLIAHFVVMVSAIQPFSFELQGATPVGSMKTRTIEPSVVPDIKPVPKHQPAPPTEAAKLPQVAAASPPIPPSTPVAELISAEQKSSSNEPILVPQAEQHDTKTVVIALSSGSEEVTSTTAESDNSPPPLQLQLPSNTRLQYIAKTMQRGQMREGRGQLIWQSDGQDYTLKIEASMLLLTVLEWSSVGKVTEVGLSPVRFSERRGFQSEQATHFRSEIGKIQFSNNKPEAVLEGGAQDRLSVMLLLSSLLAGNPGRIELGSIIRVQVANTDFAETWDIRYQGLEEIVLPTGPIQAHKLSRNPRREFDRQLDLWLAPSLAYMPVRILLVSATAPNEDFFDLKLSALP